MLGEFDPNETNHRSLNASANPSISGRSSTPNQYDAGRGELNGRGYGKRRSVVGREVTDSTQYGRREREDRLIDGDDERDDGADIGGAKLPLCDQSRDRCNIADAQAEEHTAKQEHWRRFRDTKHADADGLNEEIRARRISTVIVADQPCQQHASNHGRNRRDTNRDSRPAGAHDRCQARQQM